MDETTTIEALKQSVKNFVEEREWQQFHCPKNLSMLLAVESAELMELFLWSTADSLLQLEKKRVEVEHELADIAFALLNFCDRYDIDLTTALKRKIALNAEKYPIEKSKGKAIKYNEL
ncbi:MAG TPA: nucleotide pyrophosphohydrolase [Candidatus Babeliaceae bacterium]|nr:nucleotide pyrophosphohydrolase [Candidatus Babeliaceae bacterium]